MGAPYFKVKKYLKQHNVAVFSSNYPLYGDLSQRIMDVSSIFAPRIEVYSIDEAFLDFEGFGQWDLLRYGRKICKTTEQWTGIPVSIGFGPTKTLAKLANRVSKKQSDLKGVFNFNDAEDTDTVLDNVAVGDLWGVGRKWVEKLEKQGIRSTLDLKSCVAGTVKQRLTWC